MGVNRFKKFRKFINSSSRNPTLQSRARFEEPVPYTVMNTWLIWKVSESWVMCGVRTSVWSEVILLFNGVSRVWRLLKGAPFALVLPSTEINPLLDVRRGSLPRVMFGFYGCMWEAHMERAQRWCESTVTVVKGIVNSGPFTFMIWMK